MSITLVEAMTALSYPEMAIFLYEVIFQDFKLVVGGTYITDWMSEFEDNKRANM